MNWFGSTKTLDVHVERAAQEARRRSRRAALPAHGARRRLPLRRRRRGHVSLRLRLARRVRVRARARAGRARDPARAQPLEPRRRRGAGAGHRRRRRSSRPRPSGAARRAGAAAGRVARTRGRDLGARVIVVDLRGRLLADSAGGGLRGASYASRPEIRDGARRPSPRRGRATATTLGEELLFTAVPVLDDGRRVGAVRVTQSVEAVGERVRRNVLVARRRRADRARARPRARVGARRLALAAAARLWRETARRVERGRARRARRGDRRERAARGRASRSTT